MQGADLSFPLDSDTQYSFYPHNSTEKVTQKNSNSESKHQRVTSAATRGKELCPSIRKKATSARRTDKRIGVIGQNQKASTRKEYEKKNWRRDRVTQENQNPSGKTGFLLANPSSQLSNWGDFGQERRGAGQNFAEGKRGGAGKNGRRGRTRGRDRKLSGTPEKTFFHEI